MNVIVGNETFFSNFLQAISNIGTSSNSAKLGFINTQQSSFGSQNSESMLDFKFNKASYKYKAQKILQSSLDIVEGKFKEIHPFSAKIYVESEKPRQFLVFDKIYGGSNIFLQKKLNKAQIFKYLRYNISETLKQAFYSIFYPGNVDDSFTVDLNGVKCSAVDNNPRSDQVCFKKVDNEQSIFENLNSKILQINSELVSPQQIELKHQNSFNFYVAS